MIPHFARRTDWKTAPNELSVVLARLKNDGISILDLTESNPTHCQFKYLNSDWLRPFGDPKNLNYEPSSKGILGARQVIQNDYQSKKINISPEQIFITSSTSEAYSSIFRLLLNPNDRILIPQPSYPLFQFLADLNDAIIDYYPLIYNQGWHIDFDRLEKQIKKETKALILVHPNNPTGSFVKQKELEKIIELAKKNKMAIISDEVFSDYGLKEDSARAGSFAGIKEILTFTLGGISKTLGLPQMKLAWTIVNGPENTLNTALERLEIICDTFLSANTPAQNALGVWFAKKAEAQEEIKKRIKENQSFLTNQLASSGISYLEPEGGWYGILKISKTQSEEEWIIQFLEDDHVLIHPGYFFDFEEEAYIVISLITEANTFREGIARILKRIKEEVSAPQAGSS